MKNFTFFILIAGGLFCAVSCKTSPAEPGFWLEENIQFATEQVQFQLEEIDKSGKVLLPRTLKDGKVKYIQRDDWTSGFFPGTLWLLYGLTADTIWKNHARIFTESLDSVKYLTRHHDIGFMIECSFGNGMRLGEVEYEDVIIQAANSLITRYRPSAGVLQSWNVDKGWQSQRNWECPVIIDNMMNLELLFNATALSGDSTFYNIAVSHADHTIKNHYRKDHSCYHVVDYNIADGSVRSKETAQGYAKESSWARGQAWGIYGFTVCYRETGDPKYLHQAQKAVDFVISHPNFPDDLVPYWDFNAPNIPDEPKDASSAAILASALFELSTYVGNSLYKDIADQILLNLSNDAYRAKAGQNGNFILKHSVGSIPHGAEIDVPLSYADYYFLEALLRKSKLDHI